MSNISIDKQAFQDGISKWEKAEGRLEKSCGGSKIKLECKGSDAEFLKNYVDAIKELKEVLESYQKLLEKDKKCLTSVKDTLSLIDETMAKDMSAQ